MAYGIIHNNRYYIWHPKKADGTAMKKTWYQKVWVPWAAGEGDACAAFETREEAEQKAAELFWKDGSYRVVELDGENKPIVTDELAELGYGAPRPDAD